MKKQLFKGLFYLCLMCLFIPITTIFGNTNKNVDESESRLTISGRKLWENTNNLPKSLTIILYEDGKEVETMLTNQAMDWKYSFDISHHSLINNDGNAIQYTIGEITPIGYVEDISQHINPVIRFIPPSVQGWEKIEPCDRLVIPHISDEKSIIAARITGNEGIVAVWSEDALAFNERQIIEFSLRQQHGIGNPKQFVFFSGTGNFRNMLQVTPTEIIFSDHSDWSTYFTGTYVKNYTHITDSQIVNKLEMLHIKGNKTWDDANNNDGLRPKDITIRLFADNKEIDSKTVNEKEAWSWDFGHFPKYEKGKEINYMIIEDNIPYYSTSYNGFNITNKHLSETISITVSKKWDDDNNRDGLQPSKINVSLLANQQPTTNTLELNSNNNWINNFDSLPKYSNGREIIYTIQEKTIDKYTSQINGNMETGFTISNQHIPETIMIEGKKIWDDSNNNDGLRPNNITIRLFANNKEIDSIIVDEKEHWTWKFENLYKYENGNKILYSIKEDKVHGYKTDIQNYEIINHHIPSLIDISITKIWKNCSSKQIPSSITLFLNANGEKIQQLTLTKTNEWKGSFNNLPEFKNGQKINYTLSEKPIPHYKTMITGNASTGFIVTNIFRSTPDTSDTFRHHTELVFGVCAIIILTYIIYKKKER